MAYSDRSEVYAQEGAFETGNFEYAHEYAHESGNEYAHEYANEYAHEYAHEIGPAVGIFSHEQEAELAYELLNVNSEAELDRFLGNLISRAGQVIGQAVPQLAGNAIGGTLKNMAATAIKGGAEAIGKNLGGQAGGWGGAKVGAWAGQKLGNLVGGKATGDAWAAAGRTRGADWGKALGGTVGSKLAGNLAGMATKALGWSKETMQQEEYEFAGAQHFVRMAGEIAERTLSAPANVDPRAVAQSTSLAVARRSAPGLLTSASSGRSGRWVQRGRTIILYGV